MKGELGASKPLFTVPSESGCSLFVAQYRPGSTMHIAGYGFGAEVALVDSLQRRISRAFQGWPTTQLPGERLHCSSVQTHVYSPPFFCSFTWQQAGHQSASTAALGTAVFLYGTLHQWRCHRILARMPKPATATGYRPPQGNWFDVDPCAHYLASAPFQLPTFVLNVRL